MEAKTKKDVFYAMAVSDFCRPMPLHLVPEALEGKLAFLRVRSSVK